MRGRKIIRSFAAGLAVAASITALPLALRLPDVPTPRESVVVRPEGLAPYLDLIAARERAEREQLLTVLVWQDAQRKYETRLAAARAAAARRRAPSSTPAASGSCAAMKPAGFPDSIIQRESGGNPGAVNPSSGAAGCAQIMPFHFSRGQCVGLSYQDCWARLWAGGAGASHWACTRESGCAR